MPMSHLTANEGGSMPDPSLRLWDAHNHLHLTPDGRDLFDLLQVVLSCFITSADSSGAARGGSSLLVAHGHEGL